MPKLRTLIEIGFCSGYGDGDYGVSSEVANLSREEYKELLCAIAFAQHCAMDMWLKAQEPVGKESWDAAVQAVKDRRQDHERREAYPEAPK